MKDHVLFRSLISALIGHLTAIVLLFVLSFAMLSLDDPSSAVLPMAFVAMGAGALLCGISARKGTHSLVGALLSGLFFASVPFVISFFGKSDFFTLGIRFLMVFAMMTLSTVGALAFGHRKRKRRRKVPYSRKR